MPFSLFFISFLACETNSKQKWDTRVAVVVSLDGDGTNDDADDMGTTPRIYWQQVVEHGIKVYKGTNPEVDSYSVFWDNKKLSDTTLCAQLRLKGATDIYVCGLAYDVCVGKFYHLFFKVFELFPVSPFHLVSATHTKSQNMHNYSNWVYSFKFL